MKKLSWGAVLSGPPEQEAKDLLKRSASGHSALPIGLSFTPPLTLLGWRIQKSGRAFKLHGGEVKPMHRKTQSHNSIFGIAWNSILAVMLLVLIVVALFMVFTVQPAQGQIYQVIHHFTGIGGSNPWAGLTRDTAGNLYGTTHDGGNYNHGMVFELKRAGSGWVFIALYSFTGGDDGANPWGGVVSGLDGALYGTTFYGGQHGCAFIPDTCGVVFELRPSAAAPISALSTWNETVIHRFTGASDGGNPQGDLIFDRMGNIYGATDAGGCGNVYSLTPSGGTWVETVIDSGLCPQGGVMFDTVGNLYGEGLSYGTNGAVYELIPSGSSWTVQILYVFSLLSEGIDPFGGLAMNSSGSLYGTTVYGGEGGGGTVFEVAPADGRWTFDLLYAFSYTGQYPFPGSWNKPTVDRAGNVYGTTFIDGAYGQGSVFKLTPSNDGWTYTSPHDFTGGNDGGEPRSSLVFGANGNLYGTTTAGGTYNQGVIFEIMP